MNLRKLAIFLLVVAATAWITYQIGSAIGAGNELGFAMLGAVIATIALLLAVANPGHGAQEYIGVIWNFVIIYGAGLLLVDNALVWSLAFLVCTPAYLFIARVFYSSLHSFLFSINNAFHGETELFVTEEEQLAGYKALAFFATCAALAASLYKFVMMVLR